MAENYAGWARHQHAEEQQTSRQSEALPKGIFSTANHQKRKCLFTSLISDKMVLLQLFHSFPWKSVSPQGGWCGLGPGFVSTISGLQMQAQQESDFISKRVLEGN